MAIQSKRGARDRSGQLSPDFCEAPRKDPEPKEMDHEVPSK